MNLARELIESLVRKLLAVLFGWLILPLIAHQWIGTDVGDRLSASLNSAAAIITGTILTFIFPWLWGWWKWIVAKAKMIIAHSMPPQTPIANVQKIADSTSIGATFRLATDTNVTATPPSQ